MPEQTWNVAAVSFLNAKPLIHHLADHPAIHLLPDVPSKLVNLLRTGQADVGLLPVVDCAALRDQVRIVSDGCIGCDGPTLTVRVFCRREPKDITVLHADPDSHTSVVLAQLLWQHVYGYVPRLEPLRSLEQACRAEAVLLIGDKVVTQWTEHWPHQVDLGDAWKDLTGLPFVFAAWVARRRIAAEPLAAILHDARDRGCREARGLARRYGPERGWPVLLAEEYLTHYMKYRIDPAGREAIDRFISMAEASGLIPAGPAPVTDGAVGLPAALEVPHGRR